MESTGGAAQAQGVPPQLCAQAMCDSCYFGCIRLLTMLVSALKNLSFLPLATLCEA